MQQKTVTLSKASKKKTTKRSPKEIYQDLVHEIEKKKKENLAFIEDINNLVSRYQKEVSDEEYERDLKLVELTNKLCNHIHKKSLSKWAKEELLNWIEENHNDLASTPHASKLDLTTIETAFDALNEQVSQSAGDISDDEYLEDIDHVSFAFKMKTGIDLEDIIEKDEYLDFMKNPKKFEERIYQHYEQKAQEHFQEQSDLEKEEKRKDKKLFQNTSIHKLYKKLAKVLHPDVETDSEKKEEKHDLMVQLVKAKKENDLFTIIEMYQEHISKDDLDFSEEDFNKMIDINRKKLTELYMEQHDITRRSRIHDFVHRVFYSKSKKASDKKIKSYIKKINKEKIDLEEVYMPNIKSLKNLKPILDARYKEKYGEFGWCL